MDNGDAYDGDVWDGGVTMVLLWRRLQAHCNGCDQAEVAVKATSMSSVPILLANNYTTSLTVSLHSV